MMWLLSESECFLLPKCICTGICDASNYNTTLTCVISPFISLVRFENKCLSKVSTRPLSWAPYRVDATRGGVSDLCELRPGFECLVSVCVLGTRNLDRGNVKSLHRQIELPRKGKRCREVF